MFPIFCSLEGFESVKNFGFAGELTRKIGRRQGIAQVSGEGGMLLLYIKDVLRSNILRNKALALLTPPAQHVLNHLLKKKKKKKKKKKSDAWLPFLVAPTSGDLVIDPQHFVSGLRFYLLLPQLLRRSAAPIILDPPPNFFFFFFFNK